MRTLKYIRAIVLTLVSATILTTSNLCFDKATAQPAVSHFAGTVSAITQEQFTNPLTIVASPKSFLNKTVTMNAKFDKFSTLGLDYKPAMKSSEQYISFLIKRNDTTFDIPLSEMKLFLKREQAEKLIDLKTNDEIKITGTVFSDALGDAWIDVSNLTLMKKAP